MKKNTQKNSEPKRRVLARVLAEDLKEIQGGCSSGNTGFTIIPNGAFDPDPDLG